MGAVGETFHHTPAVSALPVEVAGSASGWPETYARVPSLIYLLRSMFETCVLQELRRQASGRPEPNGFFHVRDRDDFEVDIVLEQGPSGVVVRRLWEAP